MTTKLLYLDDTFLFETTATALSVGTDDRGQYIVLDETIFYPQGGGQPSDIGTIKINDAIYDIVFVEFDSGSVKHYVAQFAEVTGEEQAILQVDKEMRLRNARSHTAGHLLTYVIEEMFSELLAVKGHHFPDGAHVGFQNPTRLPMSETVEAINAKLIAEISCEHEIVSTYSSYDKISKTHPHLAPFIPRDKPSRIVKIGEHKALPCGGAHLTNLNQLGEVKVTKVKNRKDITKFSYVVECPTSA